MKYLLLVYTDPERMAALSAAEFDAHMKGCLEHADELAESGTLLAFNQLQPPATARAVRVREGKSVVTDGPFAETKEVLAGFNLIEADSIDEAVRIAHEFPWVRYGCLEVRPVVDVAAVRKRVGVTSAAPPPSAA